MCGAPGHGLRELWEILHTLKADVEAALGDTCRYGIITGSVTADRARVVEQDADDSRGYVVFLSPAAEAAVDLRVYGPPDPPTRDSGRRAAGHGARRIGGDPKVVELYFG